VNCGASGVARTQKQILVSIVDLNMFVILMYRMHRIGVGRICGKWNARSVIGRRGMISKAWKDVLEKPLDFVKKILIVMETSK